MIVCHCNVVNDGRRRAVDAGARSVAALPGDGCGDGLRWLRLRGEASSGRAVAHPEVAHQEAEVAAS